MGDIIERYSQVTRTSDYVFPAAERESPSGMLPVSDRSGLRNRRLKRLADLLELEMPLSSYFAAYPGRPRPRRSQCSVVGHPVREWDMLPEKTTQIYLASLESSVIDQANRSIIASLCIVISLGKRCA